jgi:hypothetical protein
MNKSRLFPPFVLCALLLIISTNSFAQKNKHFWELYLLSDYIYQSYYENDIISGDPIVSKETSLGIINSLGLGAQLGIIPQKSLIVYFGGTIKYTSAEMWLGKKSSSNLDWIGIVSEDLMMLHLGIPISIYYHNHKREGKFRLRPGFSIEPNILLHHKSELKAPKENLSQVANPESIPRRINGQFSINLKGAYALENYDEIFCEFRIHNTQKLLKEELTRNSLPMGIMIILGYKF